MITRESDYAIRAILHLAQNYGKKPVSTTELCEATEVPYRFLRKISRKLIDAKIVGSQRGKFGGLYLSKKPESISIFDILEIFDPKSIVFNSCCLPDPKCSRKENCPVHSKFQLVQDELNSKLKEFKFSDLAK